MVWTICAPTITANPLNVDVAWLNSSNREIDLYIPKTKIHHLAYIDSDPCLLILDASIRVVYALKVACKSICKYCIE